MRSKRVKKDTENQIGAKSNAAFFAFVTFAAIISVLILGYLRFSDTGQAVIEVQPQKQQESVKKKAQDGMQAKLPQAREEMFYPSANSIEGKWFSKIGEAGIAEITLDGENFELVYVQTPQDRLRRFSKGHYKYSALTGNLELFPKRGEAPSLQVKGVSYKILTMRNFQIIVLKKRDDTSIYFAAHEHDIPAKTYHPIFQYDDYAGAPVLEFRPVVAAADKNRISKLYA